MFLCCGQAHFVKGDLARVNDILGQASTMELGEREAFHVNLLKFITKIQEENYSAAETELENITSQVNMYLRSRSSWCAYLRIFAGEGSSIPVDDSDKLHFFLFFFH